MVEDNHSRMARVHSEFDILHQSLFPQNQPRPQNLQQLKHFSQNKSAQLIELKRSQFT